MPTPIRHFLLCFLIVVGIDSVSIENPQLVLTTVVRLKWAGSATEGLLSWKHEHLTSIPRTYIVKQLSMAAHLLLHAGFCLP